MDIKSSEIRLTFSIIVFTVEVKYPFSNFSSIEEDLPGIDAFGFFSDGFSPMECVFQR